MRYKIKTVMEKTGLTEKAVRYYIDKGLLFPEKEIHNGRKNYYFDDDQLQILRDICTLRYFDFSIQDIKIIFSDDSQAIQDVLRSYVLILKEKQRLLSALDEDMVIINEIKGKEQLINILQEKKKILLKESYFQPNFKHIDENVNDSICFENAKNIKSSARIFIFLLALFIGIIISGIVGTIFIKKTAECQNSDNDFSYGLVERDISVSNIEWQEFFDWRNVSFDIEGSISVIIPRNSDVAFNDMEYPNCLREINREHFVYSDGNELLYYDLVTYEIEKGHIVATGILKERNNAITAATCGYKAGFTYGDGNGYFLGYIPPQSKTFEEWSTLQNTYISMELTPYLDAFNISRTYTDTTTLHAIDIADNVKLIKMEGGILDCIIENNGTNSWEYRATVPALEMWYKGVWIELETGVDYNLTTEICPGMAKKEIIIPEQRTNSYPYLIPGIYRLVIYGIKDDCVISDDFILPILNPVDFRLIR